MHVIEHFEQGKFPEHASEDVLCLTDHHVAVIDGASTASTFRRTTDATPGRLAALAIADVVEHLPADVDAAHAVEAMTRAVAAIGTPSASQTFDERPTASFVVYAPARGEVWQVGDCQFLTIGTDGTTRHYTNAKRIDQIMASWRCTVDRSLLSRGVMTPADVRRLDPGRRLIDPFIARQIAYQNLAADHRLAYGVIDGTPLPHRFLRITPLPPRLSQLVLASDGYPTLCPTLTQSEAELRRLLDADPLCISPAHEETKGIKPGALSHDDRTYVRLRLE